MVTSTKRRPCFHSSTSNRWAKAKSKQRLTFLCQTGKVWSQFKRLKTQSQSGNFSLLTPVNLIVTRSANSEHEFTKINFSTVPSNVGVTSRHKKTARDIAHTIDNYNVSSIDSVTSTTDNIAITYQDDNGCDHLGKKECSHPISRLAYSISDCKGAIILFSPHLHGKMISDRTQKSVLILGNGSIIFSLISSFVIAGKYAIKLCYLQNYNVTPKPPP